MLRRTVTTLRKPAHTYRSPAKADRKQALQWAPWLCCGNPKCLWNGARDYAASLNIARLGLAYLVTYHDTKRYQAYRMTDASVKPASYTGAGATLLLPSQGITPRPHEGKYIYYAGWSFSISLRTSQKNSLLSLLSTAQLRKRLLKSA